MVRASLDSNILIYAALEPGSDKGRLSAQLIQRAAPSGILTVQVLLEFVAVVRRRAPDSVRRAFSQADAWASVYELAPTVARTLPAAQRLVLGHGFQIWDAVIWSAARLAGADVLSSEDLQDGFQFDGMRAVNPFVRTPEELARMFAAWPVKAR